MTKEIKKSAPSDNKEEIQNPQPQGQQPERQPTHLTFTFENFNELVTCINDSVKSKWVRNTIFNCINGLVVPVFDDEEDKPDEKE